MDLLLRIPPLPVFAAAVFSAHHFKIKHHEIIQLQKQQKRK
jgi:hypothetical protein